MKQKPELERNSLFKKKKTKRNILTKPEQNTLLLEGLFEGENIGKNN